MYCGRVLSLKEMENVDQFGFLERVADLGDEVMLENVLPSRVRERSLWQMTKM